MNIVIPMAGLGDRMKRAGYTDSKPMIDVLGKPMIQHVVEMLGIPNEYVPDATFIFIAQADDIAKYTLHEFLSNVVPSGAETIIYGIDGLTEGAACTVLVATEIIDTDAPLMIVNSDQIIDWEPNPYRNLSIVDGCIYTFDATGDHFSYARANEWGAVTEVAEKKAISKHATAGAYYWNKGSDFVRSANAMIEADDRVNGEFYTAPVYNYANSESIFIRDVKKVHHLGTPEELKEYVSKYAN